MMSFRSKQLDLNKNHLVETCRVCLLSEDFNVGATVEGVRFVNPFAVDFLLQDWAQ
jgi:hypothetical protein